jgi:phosphoribosylamine--glycine ligase
MRVLVVGSGGREHALCWAIAASPLLTQLWCAPGNAGIGEVAEIVPISALDLAALVDFARTHVVDLVIGGAEAPLAAGLADAMGAAGIRCLGPSAAAARLEASKSFTKEIAEAANVPTAAWEQFDDLEPALAFVRRRGAPIVVKADGLAAGKGVVVAETLAEAEAAIIAMMAPGAFGGAGARLVIEECLHGEEVSVFALCDGMQAVLLGAAQDHKRLNEGDRGPNTGGMGAVVPPPGLTPALAQAVMDGIILPVLAEMARRNAAYRGILFAGLMLTADGPKLIEFNVRFGDPECQALLPLLKSDLLTALLAACDGGLDRFDVRWRSEASVAVVLATQGYPGDVPRGSAIGNLEQAAQVPGVQIFHAATARQEGKLVSDGGRVLTVSALGANLAQARDRAYQAIDQIDWPEGICRRDIGWRAMTLAGQAPPIVE